MGTAEGFAEDGMEPLSLLDRGLCLVCLGKCPGNAQEGNPASWKSVGNLEFPPAIPHRKSPDFRNREGRITLKICTVRFESSSQELEGISMLFVALLRAAHRVLAAGNKKPPGLREHRAPQQLLSPSHHHLIPWVPSLCSIIWALFGGI